VQFPGLRYTGVDFLVPDLSYVRERLELLRGVVVTHGHDDHIGAIPYLALMKELDIYCMPFPEGLIKSKLAEIAHTHEVRFHSIKPGKRFRLGHFTFEPIPVRHSIIEALGFGIETPVGNIIHSGDFKHDLSGAEKGRLGFGPFREWHKKGVQLLLSDSTNAERHGHTLSEADVTRSFEKLLAEHKGRIPIALFASNIKRIENLLRIAKKLSKFVALAGRSMHSYVRLAHEQSAIKIPENTLVPLENIQNYPSEKLIILLTGSQAEPQSALLRIALGMHKHIVIQNTDRIFLSSRFIPGNERAITSMINHLCRLGAEVTYEEITPIHVSGHGFQDELLKMLRTVKPRFFVPIHGEFRHLAAHAKLARSTGVKEIRIIENGQMVELGRDELILGEKLEVEKGVEGLLHVSELGGEGNPKERLKEIKEGDEIEALIVAMEMKERKLDSPNYPRHYK